MSDYKSKSELNIIDNKKVSIKSIDGLVIDDFRKFKRETVHLGSDLSVFSGRNGTMKSTILALIAHPFSSAEKDIQNKIMSTDIKDVLNLSLEKDRRLQTNPYVYHIRLTIDNDEKLTVPVRIYLDSAGKRHRIVVSGNARGDGNFILPVEYLNFRRLFPLVDTSATNIQSVEYTPKETAWISSLYEHVFLRTDFSSFSDLTSTISSKNDKHSLGPTGSNATYDVKTISSGEDELTAFADAMISLTRIYKKNQEKKINSLTGLLVIDEFESGFHPSAQINLLNFIDKWARENKVQVILNTHSLFLIEALYTKFGDQLKYDNVCLNFIETMTGDGKNLKITTNPPFRIAYKELTLQDLKESSNLIKTKIICEDDVAKYFIERLLRTQSNKNRFNIQHQTTYENDGTNWESLRTLSRHFPQLLDETDSGLIFDADVPYNVYNVKFKKQIVIPSIYKHASGNTFVGFPIEKELVIWILNLPQNDEFFTTLKITRDNFLNSFSNEYYISISRDWNIHYDENVKKYKKWRTKNNSLYKRCLTQYIRRNKDLFTPFVEELLKWTQNN
ncbi:AAA family ATPase [Lactiplantibacillus plantarum]|uniref:AAA family ATPase n=1 Tax=Lactiplantibacillus plantarum TaxID=1590 RepID=UPI00105886A0|nr:AAA family ATPase [Lactiplantibacillus plantarum]QIA84773.1 ATP-binding protein [Lactiplantibacillus plantarum]QVG77533.1 ATP-binding protein [Lactiplantibacillus plantarum]TDH42741.1 hypothetical protein E2I17_11140 [Lactiplantibacillus plantarum]GIQ96091.1 hypothetical protein COY2906_29610 [Lactiplantibacillus plantarum]